MILEARWCGFENCCFLTLTYDDLELEKRGEVLKLDKSGFQKFMKRLRKECWKHGRRIRFYMCGEYGNKTYRPHYHCVVFNCGVGDFMEWFSCRSVGQKNGYSCVVPSWGRGFVHVAGFGERVAWYVAQYLGKSTPARKKMLEDLGLPPEFSSMSNKPGLGCMELESRPEYYRRHPINGWGSIDKVKEFARHSRYVEDKIYRTVEGETSGF